MNIIKGHEISDELVDAIETEVGVGPDAWYLIAPRELAASIINAYNLYIRLKDSPNGIVPIVGEVK